MKTILLFALLAISGLCAAQKPLSTWSLLSPSGVTGGFGADVWNVGDINGDSLSDLAVYDSLSGNLFVFKRKVIGLDTIPFKIINLASWSQKPVFAGKGDINGDKLDDLLIGFPADAGKVIGFFGSKVNFAEKIDFELNGENPGDEFGSSFDFSSDLNGDGFSDISVGAPFNEDLGRVYIWYGNNNFRSGPADLTFMEYAPYNYFGTKVSPAGDVNGDGFDEILVSHKTAQEMFSAQSHVYCYYGSIDGLQPDNEDLTWKVTNYGQTYGSATGTAGDVNGDGYSDIYISRLSGEKEIYSGSGSGLKKEFRLFTSFSNSSKFLTTVDKFNKDKYTDIAQIVNKYDGKKYYQTVEISRGNSSGLEKSPWFRFLPADSTINLSGITQIGDLNGDGYDDVIVGVRSEKDNVPGRVFLIYGTFDVYASLAIDTNWLCHKTNSFKLKDLSPDIAVTSEIKFEKRKISLSDSIYTGSFVNSGWHTVMLSVKDQWGNSHIDSLLVFSQPELRSGNYELGTGKYFLSIPHLQDSLKCGIEGDIEIIIDPGYYPHSLKLNSLTTDANKAVIKLTGKDGPEHTIISGLLIKDNHGVKVTNITIADTVSKYFTPENRLTEIKGLIALNSSELEFNNCRFHYFPYGHEVLDHYIFKAENCDNLKIRNSLFSYYPDTTIIIHDFKDYSTLCFASGDSIEFSGNRLYPLNQDYGLTIEGSKVTVVIVNNIVKGLNPADNASNNEAIYGMIINATGMKITGNRISGVSDGITISGTGIPGMDLIANNMIGGDIGEFGYSNVQNGVTLSKCDKLKFYHNTVHYSNRGGTINGNNFGFAIFIISAGELSIRNNIFRATGKESSAMGIFPVDTSKIDCDYNVYEGLIQTTGFVEYSDIGKYALEKDLDNNSLMGSGFDFEEPYKLKPVKNTDIIANRFPLLTEVLTDINGELRTGRRTDPGACLLKKPDTVKASYVNVGVRKITTPVFNVESNLIKVIIRNYSSENVDSVYISYSVNGKLVSRELRIGTLKKGDSVEYVFTREFPVESPRLYTLKVSVDLTDSYLDLHSSNDTLSEEFPIPMDGEYSLNCSTCFFPTIGEANYNLKRCGVEKKVIFSIPPGDYSDTELICENGPVVYKGATGNPADVIFKMSNIYQKKNIEIADITLKPFKEIINGNFFRQGLTLYMCDSIRFINCNFLKSENWNYALTFVRSNTIDVINCTFENFETGINFSGFEFSGLNIFNGHFNIRKNNFKNINEGVFIEGSLYYNTVSVDIDSNSFSGGNTGINLYGKYDDHNNITIRNNLFDNRLTAIQATNIFNNIRIYNNHIRSRSSSPLRLLGKDPFYNRKVYIYNNVIIADSISGEMSSVDMPGWQKYRYAIEISDVSETKIFHNTCLGGVNLVNVSDMEMKNNIFSGRNDILMNYRAVANSLLSSNNCFYREDKYVFAISPGKVYTTLQSLQNEIPSIEQNSILADPYFSDSVSFKASASVIKKKGSPVEGLYSTDINGIKRDTVNPDPGAHVISLILSVLSSSPLSPSASVEVFPNPFSESVAVISNELIRKITVTDITGQVMFTLHGNFSPGKTHLDFSELQSGVYFITLYKEDGSNFQLRAVKQ